MGQTVTVNTLESVANAKDVTTVSTFSRAGVVGLLPAASFDSSTLSPVPGKVENDAKVLLPDQDNLEYGMDLGFFFLSFSFLFTSSLASLRVCLL